MNETTTVMPVAPAYGSYGNGGFGFGNNGDFWLILILLFAFGGWGNGGFGGGTWGADGLYPWLNNQQTISGGFQNQALGTSIGALQNSITSGFGDVATQLCGGFAGVNASVNNAQNAIAQQLYANQIADLERSFNAQTATTQGMNNIGMSLQNCCCENRAGIADLKYTVATENCADRQTSTQNTQAILTALNQGVQSIKDQMCSDKSESKNDTIAQLRSELLYARGQASQDVQTAAIQAGQRALANEVEQYVAPKSIPAYIVQNPSCCNQAVYGCGCGM